MIQKKRVRGHSRAQDAAECSRAEEKCLTAAEKDDIRVLAGIQSAMAAAMSLGADGPRGLGVG